MAKDTDMMRDTGGSYNHKDLEKPSRSDRKTHNDDHLKRDPDFDDTKKDPDLKKGCRIELAKHLVALAMQLCDNSRD